MHFINNVNKNMVNSSTQYHNVYYNRQHLSPTHNKRLHRWCLYCLLVFKIYLEHSNNIKTTQVKFMIYCVTWSVFNIDFKVNTCCVKCWWLLFWVLCCVQVKPLSRQSGLITAFPPRSKNVQIAEVRAVQSPTTLCTRCAIT